MNKLGVYVTAQGFAGIENWSPRIVVSMNLDHAYLKALHDRGVFVVGRVFFDDQRIDGDHWADFMLPKIQGLQDVLDCVMAINEPAIWNPQDAMALRDATKIWSGRMHAAGFKTGAYSFSEGHPDLSLLPCLKGHGCDYYIRHEYDAPEMWSSRTLTAPRRGLLGLFHRFLMRMRLATPQYTYWRCLRYRQERAVFNDVSFIIGECGIDGGVSSVGRPQTGWKGFGDANHYADSLRWYRDEIAKDDYMLGAAIFAGNWDTGNGTFNIENIEEIRQVVNEQIQPIPPQPTKRPRAQLRALIESFEKFQPSWKDDGAGHKSIGYGHQGTPDEIRLWIYPMKRWQAVEVLNRDIDYAIATLEGAVSVPLTDNQWTALVSLRLNIGPAAFDGSNLRDYLNKGDYASAAREMLYYDAQGIPHGWIHQGGIVLAGLVERRAVEQELFNS